MVVLVELLGDLLVGVHEFFELVVEFHALNEHHREELLDLLEFAETGLYVLPIYRVHYLQTQTSFSTIIYILLSLSNLNPFVDL